MVKMKRLFIGVLSLILLSPAFGQSTSKPPVTEKYQLSYKPRSGVCLGGIGTGYVELRKDGMFYDWNIFNNIPKGTGPVFWINNSPYRNGWEENLQSFIVRYEVEGEEPQMKVLQIPQHMNEGGLMSYGNIYIFPWMSPIENIEYSGRYPFVNMKFSDPDMPLEIEMEAFSPFIPHDVKNSAIPGIYFNFNITSTSSKPVDVMIMAMQRNMVGYDINEKYFVNKVYKTDEYVAFVHTVGGMDERKSTFGETSIVSLNPKSNYYLGWDHPHPYYEQVLRHKRLPDIDDTEGVNSIGDDIPDWMPRTGGRNTKDKETGKKIAYPGKEGAQSCKSTISYSKKLAKGEGFDHTFVMTWYFPNHYGDYNADELIAQGKTDELPENIGNYYCNFFESSKDVNNYMVDNMDDLTIRSKQFVSDMYQSDLEQYVLDQINSHLNTYATSAWLSKDGLFGVREGMAFEKAYAGMYTIDVALYGSVMTAALFPDLEKAAILEHAAIQEPTGEIYHALPIDGKETVEHGEHTFNRVDMPGNFVQLATRYYFWTGDKEYLEKVWPSITKAIDYILEKRDKDGDMLPDMEGVMCSYDNFPMYGAASYIVSQWAAAIASAAEAAKILGDEDAKEKYDKILASATDVMDNQLWNGKYFRLSNDYKGEKGADEGCLTDQLVGQWVAHQSGLGHIADEEKIHLALESILDKSYKPDFGLRNCTWPESGFWYDIHRDIWVDQANTCWTGVEFGFASLLLYEGMYEEALNVIKTVDDRYREQGLYWNHIECGGHYFRPMSSWSILNGALGLGIKHGVYTFDPSIPKDNFTVFFSNVNGTAHYISSPTEVKIKVLTGTFDFNKIGLAQDILNAKNLTVKIDGKAVSVTESVKGEYSMLDFEKTLSVEAGKEVVISK